MLNKSISVVMNQYDCHCCKNNYFNNSYRSYFFHLQRKNIIEAEFIDIQLQKASIQQNKF